uniref:NADH-ubiquinone oxidoreductase chain 4 n=1 Tax=Rhagophthalmus ohbai TaxID=71225 RepID=A4PCH0_9COLE|nr:NADH dehydrogenase subunit 4 [Rhagophthalmus ohbai]BAF52867.1 NADH dehydrogenase subunit 4 [Rhagophthalmus ohbai]
MMKFIFFMFFMIPLCLKNLYWILQSIFFLLFFMVFSCFSMTWFYLDISYFMGWDFLSFFMVLLSIWICSLMIMASEKIKFNDYYENFFLLNIIFLIISLFFTFCSMNLFIFYLFFEVSLIPTLILILGWGYQPERMQAGMYMFFYTLFASLPMMISLFYVNLTVYTLDFFFFDYGSFFLYICMSMVFMVKIPMFLVHLWLPKAHVEAPVSGSMILAGVMLKLGGYGYMRMLILFISTGVKFNYLIISLSLFGGLIISMMCLRQTDIKSLIAYSSVSHMSLVLSGVLTMNSWGYLGCLMMMISHGLCSSGLFCLANISYDRTFSRSLFLNKGLINIMPVFSLWWFLFCSSNMAAPPSLNLLGEIMLINSLISWDSFLMIFLMFISFFTAAYSLYLYSYSQHGKYNNGIYYFSSGYVREYLLLMLHWLPLNILFFISDLMI